MGALQFLVIHCTATEAGEEVTKEQLIDWGLSRGWNNQPLGYSDMIHIDGHIENLLEYDFDQEVDPWEITNGVKGFNGKCRHVVYVGGIQDGEVRDTRTQKQKESLSYYCFKTLEDHPQILMAGHNQFPNAARKACPSFWVPKWLRALGFPEEHIYKADPYGYAKKL